MKNIEPKILTKKLKEEDAKGQTPLLKFIVHMTNHITGWVIFKKL